MKRRSCCPVHAGPALSRRDVLKPIAGAGLIAAGGVPASRAVAAETAPPGANAVVPIVTPFDLGDVALLDGPFRHARTRAGAYLLSLEPDRLLHGYRVNAGLKPKAPVYGGWESEPLWTDIHCQGHTLGHYLSGCALMYAATRDRRFRTRVDYIVDELKACQTAGKTGLLSAFPEGPGLMATVLSGGKYSGVPWYTLHKVYAGLRDAHRLAGTAAAREVLLRFADWAVVATRPLSDAQFETMLETEYGGMNEVMADLHAMTGNAEYADLARRFSQKAILAPLAKSRDHLDGLHANTQIPKIIGFNRVYETSGSAEYQAASRFFWRTVAETRSYVTGGHADGEFFHPVADFADHVFSPKTSETCGEYNMLKLTRMLFMQDPSAHYADYYERTLYNGILASQDPDSGMVTYFQGGRPGYRKLYCTPTDSFWCCTGSGMESHAKYGDSIYFRNDAALYVNLFIPSVLTWKDKGATITQTTRFPDGETTRLRWTLDRPVQLALNLRHPAWCARATVTVNGTAAATSDHPGSYIRIDRMWRSGDVIELTVPMTVAATPLPGHPDIVAFFVGPIVLAGAFGDGGIAPGADLIVNERRYGAYLDTPFTPPALAGKGTTIAARLSRGATPLSFTIAARDGGEPILLMPYYRIAHQRYTIYWDLRRQRA